MVIIIGNYLDGKPHGFGVYSYGDTEKYRGNG